MVDENSLTTSTTTCSYRNQEISQEWERHLSGELKVASYSTYRRKEPSAQVNQQICQALGLHPALNIGVQDQYDCQIQSLQQASPAHLESLRRILNAVDRWRPRIGFSLDLARLCHAVLCVIGSERATFGIVTGLYQRMNLLDYFECPEGVRSDVPKVLEKIQMLWPQVPVVFEQFESAALLEDLIAELLGSLLSSLFSTDANLEVEYKPLLLHLLAGPRAHGDDVPAAAATADPREWLHNAAACIVGRHFRWFCEATSSCELGEACAQLLALRRVDRNLITLLAEDLDASQTATFHAVVDSPLHAAIGWIVGHNLPALAAWTAGAVLSPNIGIACGVAGAALGIAAAIHIGGEAGRNLAVWVASEVATLEEESDEPEEEQEEVASKNSTQEEEEQQRQLVEEEPLADGAESTTSEPEPGMDFFLGTD